MANIGIDLGTTNSLVSVFRDGKAEIIANALGQDLTPSVVGLDDDGEMLVGAAAAERLITHPARTAAHFKRLMGTTRLTKLGRQKLRPEELSALVLRSLKRDAEAHLGVSITSAVISVPAYFNDNQRKATKTAGELAGIEVERLVNEPTAAAVAYGLDRKEEEGTFLVFDLGGGTFDVSILELFDGVMEVHASAGDNFLGGEDFTEAVMTVMAREKDINIGGLNPRERSWLREAAERAKRSAGREDAPPVSATIGGTKHEWQLSALAVEDACGELLQRVRRPLERALRDSNISPDQLDAVVLVGGGTKLPLIKSVVAKMLGQFPASHIDPDKVVAQGAATQAALLAKDEALRDVVMTDVCPYTLGTEVSRKTGYGGDGYEPGYFLPIIERNTTVPVSREDTLRTLDDYRGKMTVPIYQGESRRVENNIYLGLVTVPIPRAKAGKEPVRVRFTYDSSGILEVTATAQSTGRSATVVIEEQPGAMSKEEVEKRLKALEAIKVHPRDEEVNRAVMARAERLYEELVGFDRDDLARAIEMFESVLSKQDRDAVEEARKGLTALLDNLERGPLG